MPDLKMNGAGTQMTKSDLENKNCRIKPRELDAYVYTPATNNIVRRMNELLNHPTCERMPFMRLLGDVNSGKSSLLREFVGLHSNSRSGNKGADHMPVVYVLVPGGASGNEGRLYDAALQSMGVKIRSSYSLASKRQLFLDACRSLGVKVLILDDFHDAGHGTVKQQAKYCAAVNHISNELRIVVIVAGTDDIKKLIDSDPHFTNRFTCQVELTRWQHNKAYRSFLKSLEREYQSCSASDDLLAQKILDLTGGLTGEIISLLRFAAAEAAESGQEQISVKLLDDLTKAGVWITPSSRGM